MKVDISAANALKVAVIGGALVVNTRLFSNWPYLSHLFTEGGKRSWLCIDGGDQPDGAGIIQCAAQRQSLKDLFSIISGCELVGSITAGIMIDSVGPQITSLIGLITQILGMLMFIVDSKSLPLMRLGGVLSGLAINSVANPALILARYFPESKALCTAYVIACQSLATGVLPLMSWAWSALPKLSLNQLLLGFIGVAMLPTGVAYVVTLRHMTPPVKIEEEEETSYEPSSFEEKTLLISSQSSSDRLGFPYIGVERLGPRRRFTAMLCLQSCDTFSEGLDKIALQTPALTSILTSPLFIVFAEIILAAMTAMCFYNMSLEEILGKDIARTTGQWLPVQAVIVLLWGLVSDKTSTPFVMACHFIGYATHYILSLVDSAMTRRFAAALFLIHMPFTYALKYTFVMNTWPAEFHDILFGMLGGLSGLISILLGSLTRVASEKSWCYIFPIFCTLQLIPVAWIWTRTKRRNKVE